MKTLSFGTKDLVSEGTVVDPNDVGALIGKGATGCKKCISNTWKMYEKLQSSKNPVQENKPKLKIIFHPLKEEQENPQYPEQVWVEIQSESETMMKLSQLSVKKHIADFINQKSLSHQEFIIDIPHRLLGKLIGKKASGLNRLLNDAVYENKTIMIHHDDVETTKTARLRIKELEFDDPNSQKIINYIKERNNRSFLGWPPEPDDDYIEHISITLSFKRDAKPFNDILLYLERIRSVIADRVCQLKEQDDEQMDEINECLGISNDQ